jgi:diguanylate cyclase (GGDEF)-like protein
MSIRVKVFVIIFVLFALLGGADFLIQRFIIFPSFLELEYREAGENLKRVFYAIDREIVHLDRLCGDWAVWDDSYAFMEEQSEEFIDSNLNEETLKADSFNLLVFCRPDGTVVWSHAADYVNNRQISFQFLTTNTIPLSHSLLAVQAIDEGGRGNSGVLDTEFGPLLFATREILHSDGSGPGKGFLIMGRFLDQPTRDTLKEQTRIPFDIVYPFPKEQDTCGTIDSVGAAHTDRLNYFELKNGQYIKTCAGYNDASGTPLFGVQYLFPREITRKGITSMGYAAALVIFSGAVILIILNVLLQYVVLKPVQRLTEHAARLEQEGDYTVRLNLNRSDEVGRLAHSFDTMVQTISERTAELQLANEQLILLSVQDGLTGIANRRMFDNYIVKEWRRAKREQTPLSVILLDVDFFKNYNDTYGHQQGDRCLVAVAGALQQHVRRPADLAARYGGEEFVMVLPNTHAEGAMLLAERVREAVQALKIEHSGSKASPFVSVSLGVATTVPAVDQEETSMDLFLEQADQGLYMAKDQGRNRAVRAADSPADTSDQPG